MCNVKLFESIIAIIVIIFGLWVTEYSQWITVLAGVVLLVHALFCKHK
ncbi:MAG: hypothetical protein Q8L34_06630 [Candidatus Woesearchaeota archaeon]|nr:hypothetical protein [Candidatus Woesearchaeota archaeon]